MALVTKGKDAVSSIPSLPARKSSRGRLAAWLAFGAVGLATGAVWASGFATGTGGNGTTAISPALTKTAPSVATSALSSTTTAVTPLAFDWQGRWGSIAADTVMFKVDLSGPDYAGKTYNVATLLANTSDMSGWASMQLKIERVDVAASGACVASAFDGTKNPKVLNFDDEDAGVYWNALAGDAVYCIGVNVAPGDDTSGTFLRAAQDTPPTAWPTFITTVDRAS
jgi:hypothetical protein